MTYILIIFTVRGTLGRIPRIVAAHPGQNFTQRIDGIDEWHSCIDAIVSECAQIKQ